MTLPTITVIGAGQVGATTAHVLLQKQLAHVTLIDVVEGLAAGKALDLLQAAATDGLDVRIAGTTDFSAMAGSRIVVVTAGQARTPGMSRDDLLSANAKIVGPIADQIARHAPDAVVIVVTNPLDVMTYLAFTRTGFSRQRVCGMAGVLDSSRLRAFIAQRLQVSPARVQSSVLGSHGDLMVPVTSWMTVDGKPLTSLLPSADVEQLLARTRNGGAEIVTLLKTSSAYYAPAAGVVQMIQAMLQDDHHILPVAAILDGEYGLRDVCIGVPAELGRGGVTRVIEQPLTDPDRRALQTAAQQVRGMIEFVSNPQA